MEGDEHLAAHLIPRAQLVVGEPEANPQGGASAPRQQVEHPWGSGRDPGSHQVGIGVVAQSTFVRPGVALVELVGTHHPVDLIPVALS